MSKFLRIVGVLTLSLSNASAQGWRYYGSCNGLYWAPAVGCRWHLAADCRLRPVVDCQWPLAGSIKPIAENILKPNDKLEDK
jgi:hypothetical protein